MKMPFGYLKAGLRVLIANLLLASLAGCSLLEIKKQAEFADTLASIHGSVEQQSTQQGPIYVALYRKLDSGFELVRKTVLGGNKKYEFVVEPGTYALGAFVDANNDGEYQVGEHASYLGVQSAKPTPIELLAKSNVTSETLNIKGPIAVVTSADEQSGLPKIARNTGRVIALDDPMFTQESAEMGLWRPIDFVEQYGGGLMMLQAFDKDKIPVLFVHGISGSARSFEKIIAALNKDEFQPWVLQYPSGLRLDAVSNYLKQGLDDLYVKYKFPRIMIVAHSMGGLMTRSFMMKYVEGKGAYQIALGVTINSPLYGMDSAASGVKSSPIVVPAWRDLASNGEYVKRVSEWQWPKNIPYHLFFSYLPGEPSDGVIPMKSQLSLSLQDQAVAIHGFQGEHTGVLSDPEFTKRLTAIISRYGNSPKPQAP